MTVANPERPEELVLQLVEAAELEAEEEIVSVADYLHKKGVEEGQRRMLLKQLERRFGALPEAVVQRVQAADAQILEEWIERVVTAFSLDEVLGAV